MRAPQWLICCALAGALSSTAIAEESDPLPKTLTLKTDVMLPVPFSVTEPFIPLKAGTEVKVKSIHGDQVKISLGSAEGLVALWNTDFDERARMITREGENEAARQPSQPRNVPRTAGGEPVPYFGEIVIGDKSIYVGEVVPVELRFYFRADCQFDNLQRPTFGGDGFTAAALSEHELTEQYIEDIPYNIVTFRSAVTPAKPGELEIPPAHMKGRMITQGGMPAADSFFDAFFQNFPMPGFGRAENIQVSTDARRVDVLPLR